MKRRKNKYYPYGVDDTKQIKSNDRKDIIDWVYYTHIVEFYVTYLLKQTIDYADVQDKIQEFYVMICEIPDAKLQDLYRQGKHSILAYITGMIHQQLITTNSRIYYKYVQYNKKEINKDELFWELYEEGK